MPPASRAAAVARVPSPGHWKFLRRLSIEVRRQANSGPTPVRNSRKMPIGTMRRLNQTASREIFSLANFSVITGNSVPHRTAKQLARRIRLLNRKLDSRETTLSSSDSLLRNSSRSRISQTVAEIPRARNTTKNLPMGDSAKACTDCTMPERVRKVPKMQRKKVEAISTIFQIFIMPFFSCIITECRKAVAASQGSREAFSTGSHIQ